MTCGSRSFSREADPLPLVPGLFLGRGLGDTPASSPRSFPREVDPPASGPRSFPREGARGYPCL